MGKFLKVAVVICLCLGSVLADSVRRSDNIYSSSSRYTRQRATLIPDDSPSALTGGNLGSDDDEISYVHPVSDTDRIISDEINSRQNNVDVTTTPSPLTTVATMFLTLLGLQPATTNTATTTTTNADSPLTLAQLQQLIRTSTTSADSPLTLAQLQQLVTTPNTNAITPLSLPQLQQMMTTPNTNAITALTLPQLQQLVATPNMNAVTPITLPQLQQFVATPTTNAVSPINLPQLQQLMSPTNPQSAETTPQIAFIPVQMTVPAPQTQTVQPTAAATPVTQTTTPAVTANMPALTRLVYDWLALHPVNQVTQAFGAANSRSASNDDAPTELPQNTQNALSQRRSHLVRYPALSGVRQDSSGGIPAYYYTPQLSSPSL